MIWDQIEQIKRVLREIFYFKRIIRKYGAHLLPERYYLFPSLRAIAADNADSMENATRYFAKNIKIGKIQKLIAIINKTNYYQNSQTGEAELYEAVYSANNYDQVREIKLFSFARKEILTLCTCEEAMRNQLAEYESLHKYFSMPPVEMRDTYENAYRIAMVDLISRPDERLAMETISQCVANYHCAHSVDSVGVPVKQILAAAYAQQEFNDILVSLSEKISLAVQEMKLPTCFQHGDLSRDNLIYGICEGKTDFWWIDWEHARQRLFFYDYFFYILNTAVYFDDATALLAYLNGDYDTHLQWYFSQFGLQYDHCFRKDYFLIFAIAFLKERVCDKGSMDALEMYRIFINKMVIDEV